MRAAIFICLVLLQVRASALFDVYIEVTPDNAPFAIPGDSVDPLYAGDRGWIEVSSFETGLDHGVTTAFREFTLVKAVDQATNAFFENLTAGAAIDTVKMVVVSRTPQRVEVWDIVATTCFFRKQSFVAQAPDGIVERITFSVQKFEWSYIQVGPSGDAITEIFANWDTAGNGSGTATAGTRTPDYVGGSVSGGIAFGWLSFYFGHPLGQAADMSRPTDDPDGDGLDNLHEFIAHTHPRVPQSVLRVTAFQPAGAGNFSLTWQSIAGLNYRIFTAPAPGGPFTFLKNVASAGNGTTSTTVAGPAGQFFYRVVTP